MLLLTFLYSGLDYGHVKYMSEMLRNDTIHGILTPNVSSSSYAIVSLRCRVFRLVCTSDNGLQFLHQELEVLVISIYELANRLVITTLSHYCLLALESER